jgi:transcriptional regulator with XRE-family HTH domain
LSPQRLGIVLKQLREKRGLTQQALAKRAGIAQGYLSELEAGREKNPGIETLRKLAKALKVSVVELVK